MSAECHFSHNMTFLIPDDPAHHWGKRKVRAKAKIETPRLQGPMIGRRLYENDCIGYEIPHNVCLPYIECRENKNARLKDLPSKVLSREEIRRAVKTYGYQLVFCERLTLGTWSFSGARCPKCRNEMHVHT